MKNVKMLNFLDLTFFDILEDTVKSARNFCILSRKFCSDLLYKKREAVKIIIKITPYQADFLKELSNETKVGRNWCKSIHFDKLSCRQTSFSCKGTPARGGQNVFSVLSTF
jgi:hypothetical protein